MSDYAGIDYGLGRTNINKETGIRYGVISQHTIGESWYEAAEADYGDPHCPECGNKASDSTSADSPTTDTDWFTGKDYYCLDCQQCFWSDSAFPDEALSYSFQDADYTLTDCLDSDVMIIKAPFYTFAQFCSPCVPGAGNLDNPCETGAKTYCLGHDWFEGHTAPYPVYRVSDDAVVLPDVQS